MTDLLNTMESIQVKRVEHLPFTVRLVKNDVELRKAVAIRHLAYARHLPEFAQMLTAPEPMDYNESVVILLAESKVDGSPIGTLRIQSNHLRPLEIERSLKLPVWLQGTCLVEATRLGVTNRQVGHLVKTVLFKAFYQYCQQRHIDWVVVTGRSPIDRQYEQLLFCDVYPGQGYIPMRHVHNVPHRVMALHIQSAQARWTAVKHPLLDFMCHTDHPDIDLGPTQCKLRAVDKMPSVCGVKRDWI
ncbi:MAG: hypothetical protein AB3X41_08970 [Leptothrix ochracea]|uniref:hypothetical protein n=1 Tax=Leptothrix ochracea TaxID=735331 RepID=UPI0034E22540